MFVIGLVCVKSAVANTGLVSGTRSLRHRFSLCSPLPVRMSQFFGEDGIVPPQTEYLEGAQRKMSHQHQLISKYHV